LVEALDFTASQTAAMQLRLNLRQRREQGKQDIPDQLVVR